MYVYGQNTYEMRRLLQKNCTTANMKIADFSTCHVKMMVTRVKSVKG